MKIKQVTVESRRSCKIGTEYLTFSCGLVAEIDDGDDYYKIKDDLFDECNQSVDDQVEGAIKGLTK